MKKRNLFNEPVIRGLFIRILHLIAMYFPSETMRTQIHRLRGVKIGKKVFIMPGVILETAQPHRISIGNNVNIGIRTVIMAHFRGTDRKDGKRDHFSVVIEDDVYIGHGAIILPNIKIGRGSVVTAGSVVSRSIPPMTMVQGNPAKPIAKCGIPLGLSTKYEDFIKNLRPIRKATPVVHGISD